MIETESQISEESGKKWLRKVILKFICHEKVIHIPTIYTGEPVIRKVPHKVRTLGLGHFLRQNDRAARKTISRFCCNLF